MSRSIHTTWKHLQSERQIQYSDDELKDNRLRRMRDDLNNKSFIKKRKLIERRQVDISFNADNLFDPSTINIEIQGAGEFVHYPASKSDLIEVVKRMPTGVLSGIDSIILCLGKEYQEKCKDEYDEEVRDPYKGRISCDDNGIFYASPVSGTYFPDTCKIFLYAYVYDKTNLKLEIIELFLRLQMLSTFVHEAAHHDDNMRRTGRGRWLGLNEWKCEDYAELKQMEWSKEVILPYLSDQYPYEYDNLTRWIEKHGGVKFPLGVLAGESKRRRIGDMVKLVFSASSAVEELFLNVINDKSPREAMFEFARSLHYGDYYEECLISLDSLLDENPHDTEVMGIKADTFIHLERYNEAETMALECLSMDRNNTDALEALCDVQQHMKDWNALIETCARGIEAIQTAGEDTEHWEIRVFVEMKIIAALHLGEFNLAKEAAKLLPQGGFQEQRRQAFLALIALLDGDSGNAMDIAKSILSQDKVIGPAKAILKSVYNKAVYELGECGKQYVLSEYEKGFLEATDIIDLVEA